MDLNPGIFRQYDVRGVAETDLNDAFSTALGRAYGTFIRRKGGTSMALGRDARLSGPRIMEAFEAGVRAAGLNVIRIGLVPTPLLYFSLHNLEVDGGVIVTGSHNPAHWNGFKMCQGKAALYGDNLQRLREIIETEDYESGEGTVTDADVIQAYADFVLGNIKPGPERIKVVLDAGNGAGGFIGAPLYEALGFDLVALHCTPDGTFPNHHPDPTVEENLADLKAAVAKHGAHVGIAYDGDGDRIGAVDHKGRVVWGDQLLLFFGRDVLKTSPGATIVSEVKCSRILYDELAKAGGKAEMWKVGHSLIKARMKETGALLAGEMSGHLFFADRFFGFDDAIYAGARLLELLSNSTETLADRLDALPKSVTTPELRVSCPDEDKFNVVERAVEHFAALYTVNDIDGVRINFPTGWGLVRASNTQPVLVMRFEADTQAALDTYRGEVEAWLRECAPEVDLAADPNH